MAAAQTDEQLLVAYLRGDGAMFAELVRRYEAPLHAFICRLTGAPGAAPDLFQETWLRAFQHAAAFRGSSSLKTWLYAIAANVCRSHQQRGQGGRDVGPAPATEAADRAAGPSAAAEADELGNRIAAAVAALPLEQREVFVLRAYEDLTYPEIARALGRPLGTVKSQMRLALGKLRGELHAIADAYGITGDDSL